LRQLGSLQDSDLLSKIVDLFVHQAPGRLEAIHAAIRERGQHDLTAAAHALRGSAANVGATQVARLCLKLEVDHMIDHDEAMRLTGQLTTELDVACRALKQALLTERQL